MTPQSRFEASDVAVLVDPYVDGFESTAAEVLGQHVRLPFGDFEQERPARPRPQRTAGEDTAREVDALRPAVPPLRPKRTSRRG